MRSLTILLNHIAQPIARHQTTKHSAKTAAQNDTAHSNAKQLHGSSYFCSCRLLLAKLPVGLTPLWFMLPAGERRKQGRADRRSTEISAVIRNTLEQTIITELLPNSQIDVHVQVYFCPTSHHSDAWCNVCMVHTDPGSSQTDVMLIQERAIWGIELISLESHLVPLMGTLNIQLHGPSCM